jgi:transcriptional regulator with XRE-family HTH domain
MRAAGIDPDLRGGAAELARKAGLSDTQVSRWLQGKQPSIDNLRRVAPVLHIPMSELLVAAEYVTPDEIGTATTTAEHGIAGDTTLSEREKRLMLRMLSEVRDRTDADPQHAPPGGGGAVAAENQDAAAS